MKKHTLSDAGHRVGDGDARQATAVCERITSDAGHGVTYGDTRQIATVRERRTSDAGHGVGDGDPRQTATARVFAKYCIPIRCTYKGRKMILVVS